MRILLRSARTREQAGGAPPNPADESGTDHLVYETAGGAGAESAVCLLASLADCLIDATADAAELAADAIEAEARAAANGAKAEATEIRRMIAKSRIMLGADAGHPRTEVWLVPESAGAEPVLLTTLRGAEVRSLLRDALAGLAGVVVRNATVEGRAVLASLARPADAPDESPTTRWSVLGTPNALSKPVKPPSKRATKAPEPDPDEFELDL